MEIVEGGRNQIACGGSILGAIGLTAAIAAAPVTGGISALAWTGYIASSSALGLSLGSCLST